MDNCKKSLAGLLSIVLFFSTVGTVPTFSESKMEKALILNDLTIISGVNGEQFNPDLDTLADVEQGLKVVVSALNWEVNSEVALPYTDVSAWAMPYVAKAIEENLISPESSTVFGAKNPITYRELTKWLQVANKDGFKDVETKIDVTDTSSLTRGQLIEFVYDYIIDTPLVINELKVNIPEDEHSYQFIELKGMPKTTIFNTYLLVIDGDEGEEGKIDYLQNLNGQTVGENGLILIKNEEHYNEVSSKATVINDKLIKTYEDETHEDGIIEHDAITFMLVTSQTPLNAGQDLDSDNDGILELPEDAKILDSLGWTDGGEGICYSAIQLSQSASDPDAATRFSNNMSAFSIDAWANGDIFEDPNLEDEDLPAELRYDPSEASSNLPPNAKLSPGEQNFINAPLVLLNEISISEELEYLEVISNGHQDLSDVYVVVIDNKSKGKASYVKNLSGYETGRAGLLVIQNDNDNLDIPLDTTRVIETKENFLPDDSASILLIYCPDQMLDNGYDFDQDNDMKIDILGENSQVLDEIAYGSFESESYGDVLFEGDLKALSRYRGNRTVGKSAWFYGKLDALMYILENSTDETLHAGITPGGTNITEVTSYLVKPTLESNRTIQIPPDADDIAIWVHPSENEKSFVIGTQKEAGYSIYDVSGQTLADVNPGDVRYNNVDVVYGFDMKGEKIDIAVFTDRMYDQFVIFKITDSAPYLTNITDASSQTLFGGDAGEDTAYGSTVYKSPTTGKVYAYATQNDKNKVSQFELVVNGDKIGWNKVRDMILLSGDDDEHAEGMVVDQEYGTLYIAQEEVGIYKTSAEPNGPTGLGEDTMIAEEGDYNLREDIEGMTLYYKSDGNGYLVVSSQGSSTFAVFDRISNDYILGFAIVDSGNKVDGSEDTDSLDVVNGVFGPIFEKGVLIAQDGQDTSDDPADIGTNFKWVRWEDIAEVTGLEVDTLYNPREPENRQ